MMTTMTMKNQTTMIRRLDDLPDGRQRWETYVPGRGRQLFTEVRLDAPREAPQVYQAPHVFPAKTRSLIKLGERVFRA